MTAKGKKALDEVTNATHVWLSFAPCGCIQGIADDIPMNGTVIGKWIKRGEKIERMTFDKYWNRQNTYVGRKCPHGSAQGFLLEIV